MHYSQGMSETPDPESGAASEGLPAAQPRVPLVIEPISKGLPLAALLLALCLAIPTFPLWTGAAHGVWDIETFYFGAFSLLADAAREGYLLLWNLWASGGRPELADPQVGGLSPVILLAGLLFGGSLAGFAAYWLAIWLATGLGMTVLARHLGAPLWGAVLVGAALIGSGFAIGHAQHTAFLATFAYSPWILWRLDVALKEQRGRRPLVAAQVGVLFGLSAIGGYPALVFIAGLLAAGWALGRLLFGWAEDKAAPKPRVRDLALVAALAGVLCLAVLAPTYAAFAVETKEFGDRTEPMPRERAIFEGSIHPVALMTAIAPRLILAPTWRLEIWGLRGYHMGSVYLGATCLLLALLALCNEPRSAFRWWLAFLVLFFLALAAGPLLPLRGWLYDFVPPSRYFRHSMIFRGAALIAIAALAALAARDRRTGPRAAAAWDRRLALLSLGLTPVVGLLLFLVRRSDPQLWHALPRGHAIANVLAWLAPAAAVGFAVWIGRRPLLPALLAAVALVEASAGLWVCRSMVYTSSNLAQYAELEQARSGQARGGSFDQTARGLERLAQSRFGAPNNRDAVERVAVLRSLDPLSSANAFGLGKLPLAVTVTGPERTWFAPAVGVAAGDPAIVQQLSLRFQRFGAPVLVLHPLEGQPAPASSLPFDQLPSAQRVPIELRAYLPEKLHFAVEVPADGWLWVTDRYAPGWRARVDGEATPIWMANGFFRAIEVQAGRHEVVFTYHPFGHPWLLILSWSTFGAVVALSAVDLRRRRRVVAMAE
jgi:hypothetical protein